MILVDIRGVKEMTIQIIMKRYDFEEEVFGRC